MAASFCKSSFDITLGKKTQSFHGTILWFLLISCRSNLLIKMNNWDLECLLFFMNVNPSIPVVCHTALAHRPQ